MPNKVFHIDDVTHALVHKYCTNNNLKVKEWLADVLFKIISDMPITQAKIDPNSIVTKKELTNISESDDQTDPWSKPPFWAK